MDKFRKNLLFSFLAVLVLVLVGCGNSGSNSDEGNVDSEDTSEKVETVNLSLAYMPNFASVSTFVAAERTGAFEEEGLNVELVEFADGPTIISAMESGSIDIGYIGPGAHVLPIQGQAKILSYSHMGNADEVLARTDRGIATMEDLKGKKIAVASGTSSEMILNLTLEEAGLTRDDVELVDMDASSIVTAMVSGSIDAAAIWSPGTITIKNELGDNVVMLSNNERYTEDVPSIASFVVSPTYAEENPDLLVRVLRALYKGNDYKLANLDEVATWTAEQLSLDEEALQGETETGIWATSEEIKQMIDDGTLDKLYNQQAQNFVSEGRLEESEVVSSDEYVLYDLILEALGD